ncbi:hypothetical protein ABGT24_08205 [Peribacillus frigoritolerans]|uniref:hypothetical protein n=1 Tax=Peribacillus frigoritolerans TaxID=450367 RepID=UPI00345D3D86
MEKLYDKCFKRPFWSIMTGGLWAYLEKKPYKEAAKLLAKIGVGGNAIGLASFLTWYSARCLEGLGPWASNTVEKNDSILNKRN